MLHYNARLPSAAVAIKTTKLHMLRHIAKFANNTVSLLITAPASTSPRSALVDHLEVVAEYLAVKNFRN